MNMNTVTEIEHIADRAFRFVGATSSGILFSPIPARFVSTMNSLPCRKYRNLAVHSGLAHVLSMEMNRLRRWWAAIA
jgi:hypothetical protein